MRPCEEFELFISMDLDNMLSEQESCELQVHLQSCPDCRAVQAQLAQMQQGLVALSVSPPADLTQRVLEKISHESAAKPAVREAKAKRSMCKWMASAAALLLLVSAAALGSRAFLPSSDADQALANDILNVDEDSAVDEYALQQVPSEFRISAQADDMEEITEESELTNNSAQDRGSASSGGAGSMTAPVAPAKEPETQAASPVYTEADSAPLADSAMPAEDTSLLDTDVVAGSSVGATGGAGADSLELYALLTQAQALDLLKAHLNHTSYSAIEAQAYDESLGVYPFSVEYADGTVKIYEVCASDGSVTVRAP